MKIFKISLIALLAVFITACEKETADLSESTYYVAFDIQGNNPLEVQVGSAFTDPGCVATLQGVDVSSQMTIKSDVDPNTMGMYQIEYSAVNADGLVSRAVRDVIVCNPSVTTDLGGIWIGQAGTERVKISDPTVVRAFPGYSVTIEKLAPGFFKVSDFLGGYYSQMIYPQYGSLVSTSGYFSLDNSNVLTLISSYNPGWGDTLAGLNEATYDPVTGILKWKALYAGDYSFNLVLKKQ